MKRKTQEQGNGSKVNFGIGTEIAIDYPLSKDDMKEKAKANALSNSMGSNIRT